MNKRIIFTLLILIFIFIFERISDHQIDKIINNLFLIEVNDYFDKTILGELSLKVSDSKRIYTARYLLNENDQKYTRKPLHRLVDLNTWEEVKSIDNNIRTFQDTIHIYHLYYLEDVFMNCIPKNKKNKIGHKIY